MSSTGRRVRLEPPRHRPRGSRTGTDAGAPRASDRVRSAASLAIPALLGALPFVLVVTVPDPVLGAAIREDGPVEWLGAAAWSLAAVLFAVTALSLRRAGASRPSSSLFLWGLASVCLVALGEEISWGQRLVGYATPELVARFNLQSEMNLHNLSVLDSRLAVEGEDKSGLSRWLTFGRIGSLIWMGYLVALPLLVRASPPLRTLAEWLRLPLPPLAVALTGVTAYLAFQISIGPLSDGEPGHRLTRVSANEVKETVVATLFLATAWAHFAARGRLLRPSRSPVPSASG